MTTIEVLKIKKRTNIEYSNPYICSRTWANNKINWKTWLHPNPEEDDEMFRLTTLDYSGNSSYRISVYILLFKPALKASFFKM
jgi:hypothetical protein